MKKFEVEIHWIRYEQMQRAYEVTAETEEEAIRKAWEEWNYDVVGDSTQDEDVYSCDLVEEYEENEDED